MKKEIKRERKKERGKMMKKLQGLKYHSLSVQTEQTMKIESNQE